jgi:putative FmdB family regulatory protein
MPIYEYQCTECDHIIEKIESFKSEIRTIICPFCNGISNRILSLGSFHLKGSGWYKDGYGKKKQEAKTETKTESPPKTSDGVTKARSIVND